LQDWYLELNKIRRKFCRSLTYTFTRSFNVACRVLSIGVSILSEGLNMYEYSKADGQIFLATKVNTWSFDWWLGEMEWYWLVSTRSIFLWKWSRELMLVRTPGTVLNDSIVFTRVISKTCVIASLPSLIIVHNFSVYLPSRQNVYWSTPVNWHWCIPTNFITVSSHTNFNKETPKNDSKF
jgi:hypothetical protein